MKTISEIFNDNDNLTSISNEFKSNNIKKSDFFNYIQSKELNVSLEKVIRLIINTYKSREIKFNPFVGDVDKTKELVESIEKKYEDILSDFKEQIESIEKNRDIQVEEELPEEPKKLDSIVAEIKESKVETIKVVNKKSEDNFINDFLLNPNLSVESIKSMTEYVLSNKKLFINNSSDGSLITKQIEDELKSLEDRYNEGTTLVDRTEEKDGKKVIEEGSTEKRQENLKNLNEYKPPISSLKNLLKSLSEMSELEYVLTTKDICDADTNPGSATKYGEKNYKGVNINRMKTLQIGVVYNSDITHEDVLNLMKHSNAREVLLEVNRRFILSQDSRGKGLEEVEVEGENKHKVSLGHGRFKYLYIATTDQKSDIQNILTPTTTPTIKTPGM